MIPFLSRVTCRHVMSNLRNADRSGAGRWKRVWQIRWLRPLRQTVGRLERFRSQHQRKVTRLGSIYIFARRQHNLFEKARATLVERAMEVHRVSGATPCRAGVQLTVPASHENYETFRISMSGSPDQKSPRPATTGCFQHKPRILRGQ